MNNSYLTSILLAPVISEKSTSASENNKQFVFRVERKATKIQVRSAVEIMFKVEVESVNILNMQGKQKRGQRSTYKKPDWKKAYVKLKNGHDIEFSIV